MNVAPSLNASIAVTLTALTASPARTTPALKRCKVVKGSLLSLPVRLFAFPFRGKSKSRGFRRSNIPINHLYDYSLLISLFKSIKIRKSKYAEYEDYKLSKPLLTMDVKSLFRNSYSFLEVF